MMHIPLALLAASIPSAKVFGRPDVLVQRITTDSHQVQPGDLFACIRGQHHDGHHFASQAIRQGATAILLEKSIPTLDRHAVGIVQVHHVANVLTILAPRFYNHPSLKLKLVGVTGTNGKTTVTYLLRSILEAWGQRVGLLGTISYEWPGCLHPATNTTPMAWEVQRLLFEMTQAQCQQGLMEVSSHALVEGRVSGCEFDVAIYTNLGHEHLDFHKTMPAYAAAKKRLFTQLVTPGYKASPKYAIINWDNTHGREMARAAQGARIITYALNTAADYRADRIRMTAAGTTFRLHSPKGSITIHWPLLGEYNIRNALAAAAAAEALGAPLPAVKLGLEQISRIPGRLEKIISRPFTVIVDYAHKPQALEEMLQTMRQVTPGQLLLVFGCGGERDKTKRAPMGEIAVRLADQVWVTSDNPRGESPQRIIQDILVGCRRVLIALGQQRLAQQRVHMMIQRNQAIQAALRSARAGDTVIIAGKGHENYQIIKDKKIHFDDREAVRHALKQLRLLSSAPRTLRRRRK